MRLGVLTGIFSCFWGTTEESITEVEVAESLHGLVEDETELMGNVEAETELTGSIEVVVT